MYETKIPTSCRRANLTKSTDNHVKQVTKSFVYSQVPSFSSNLASNMKLRMPHVNYLTCCPKTLHFDKKLKGSNGCHQISSSKEVRILKHLIRCLFRCAILLIMTVMQNIA